MQLNSRDSAMFQYEQVSLNRTYAAFCSN